jgi:endoglucanase
MHSYKSFQLFSATLLVALTGFISSASAVAGSFLKANGVTIRNNSGQGDVVPLRGVNLGGWLLMEGWMTPMDSSGLADNYSVVQTLNTRFGVSTQESLIKTYQEAWITTNDLDNIKALGMNCVRLPFWWGNVQRLDGTWRADAFEKMDWLVTNAWARGIYTVIDFHGVPGGQSTSDSTAQANQNQYWSSVAYQNQTSLIWSNVAAHFSGNPAIAGYDLINEPFGAPGQTNIWNAYNSLYQKIRSVDPDHMIFMEGTWTGTGTNGQSLNWQWDVLPPPSLLGWTNVAYSMHAYAGSTTASGEQAETDKQVNDFNTHQSWNIPGFIGEFNSHGTQSAWQYSVLQYDQNNMSWDNWAYKAIAGGVGNAWGIYDPTGTWPAIPDIQNDSATTISNKWSQWKTSSAFGITPFLKQYLGAPVAVTDLYTNTGTLTVNSNNGVLANDFDTNLGLSGISLSATLVAGPTNGLLDLNADGSFTYTPNGGFSGMDTFRYRVFDGYVNSANIATVSISTISNAVAGAATKLIWFTQPDLATNGLPFGQQPILMTADAAGIPSTNGLPASLVIAVTHTAGAGAMLGTTSYDLGLSAAKGVVNFTNLQVDTAGASNQLTASILLNPAVSRLTNGNFNSPNSSTTPTGWTAWTYGGGYANHEIVSPAPSVLGNYDGTYQMTCGAANTSDGGGFYQMLTASAGLVYTLTVSSGVQNWWFPSGEMRLFFFDANTNGLATNIISVTTGISGYDVGKPYQPYQLSAVAPVGTTQAKVEFAGFGGGSVWFDNAVLIESNNVPAIASAVTVPFTVYPAIIASQTNYIAQIAKVGNDAFTVSFVGTPGAEYYVQTTTDIAPPIAWQTLANSTNVVTNANGGWVYNVTNTDARRFYRSVAIEP